MKRNTKRFLALGLAILMAGSPVTHLQAEEGEPVETLEQVELMEISALDETVVEEEADVEEETVQEETVVEEIVEEETVEEIVQEETIVEEIPEEEILQEENSEKKATEAVQIENEALKEEPVVETTEKEEAEERIELPEIQEVPAEPEEPAEEVENGDYNVNVDSSSTMFKIESCVLTKKDEEMSAVITLSGTGYDYLYLGTGEEAATAGEDAWIKYVENAEGKYTYTIPVSAFDTPIAVAAHSIKNDKWYDRTLTFKSEGMEKIEPKLENGNYNVNVETSSSMFKVVNSVLTSKDGVMSAVITLSGTGYDYLYMGTGEEAAAANGDTWIKYVENAEGQYTYTIPVTALDTPIAVAAHSIKNDKWYDRTLTFKSEGLEKIESETPDSGDSETPETPEDSQKPETDETVNNNIPDQESGHVTDLSGGTVRVNSSTTLKDGIYTPDQFSWSGGTGRVGISCNKITVKNGQAYATIVFSSGSYSYIKANGSIYYGTNTGSTSTFVIPVALNKNNTIIGMTTAMSVAHEIRYNIFIYLAAAAQGEQAEVLNNQKLDEQAPVIAGLTYEEEIEMEYTEYVKLYRYENDVLLLEIDMKTDTKRELLEGETENLYEGNVVKYLIVPEDAEIPVGLEKNVVIIQKPVEKAYIADEEILSLLKEIGVDEEILFEGEKEEIDYKEMVKNKCNLAVLSSDLLEEEDDKALLEVSERFATLQIPLFVDRMEDEEEEAAKLEWLKVYGAIFDCEEKANAIYEEKLAEIEAQ